MTHKLDRERRWMLAFGCRLRTMRENRDMSRREFAERLGVSYETVRSWEYARLQPRALMLGKICDAFGVSADVLLGRGSK